MKTIGEYFEWSDLGTDAYREIRGGLTTFLTMAYIIVVNPAILASAFIDSPDIRSQLMTATVLATAVGTTWMALVARYPITLAPGMGLNAFFSFTVVKTLGFSWQQALTAVFVSGLIFFVISLTKWRTQLVEAIPHTLKIATAVGIGLFLATIGLTQSKVIVAHPETLLTLGDLTKPVSFLTLAGLMVMGVLMMRRISAAILLGIIFVSVVYWLGESGNPESVISLHSGGWLAWPAWPVDIFWAFDWTVLNHPEFWAVVAAFLFVDFFDTAGTLLAIGHTAGFVDEQGNLPRSKQAFLGDAVATCAGAMFGTSPVTSYIESAAGIEAGGRSGASALITVACFALSLFMWPLLLWIPSSATAPALILVGAMMVAQIQRLSWTQAQVAIPALLTILGIPLTYSIASGISLGVVSHGILALTSTERQQLKWPFWILFVCAFWWLTHSGQS